MSSHRFTARAIVTLKPVVNDPQGLTVKGALHKLGFEGVEDVRVGKFIEMRVRAADEDEARRQVGEMCRKLLANHVIEDVRFQIERAHAQEPSAERVAAG